MIGGLLLAFGLQWLRKAILRSSGRKAIHDEEAIYREEVEAARARGAGTGGLDMFGFMVSFKGVFLEGMEVVFIVITFGLNADDVPVAAVGAGAAVRARPDPRRGAAQAAGDDPREHPEVRRRSAARGVRHLLGRRGPRHLPGRQESLAWPGEDLALVVLILAWVLLSRVLIAALRVPRVESATLAQEVAR